MSDEQANAVDGGDDGAEPSADPDAVEGEPNDAEREPDDASSETGGAPIEEIAERVGVAYGTAWNYVQDIKEA